MRKKATFALVVVGLQLTSACGRSSPTETITVPGPTEAVRTTLENELPQDERRAGFGENGEGIASIRFDDNVRTVVDTRVFRRVRFEEVNGRRVANFRDVFVATAVTRTAGDEVMSMIHVDGYVTEGDDPSAYPMRGFGDAGRVSVALVEKSPDWSDTPSGFTVVSREVLAVAFPSRRVGASDAGLLELYDLASGKLAANLGEEGRIVVPKSIGIDDVHEVAFREIDDDGLARLVVAGVAYDDANRPKSPQDVVIAGFATDGSIDGDIGMNGSGIISLDGMIGDLAGSEIREIRLADPGLSQVSGVIGALVTTSMPDVPQTTDLRRRGKTELIGLVARAPRTSGPITTDKANGAHVQRFSVATAVAQVRNVIFDKDYSLDVHIMGRPLDATTSSDDEFTNEVLSFTSPSLGTGVTVRSVFPPFVISHERWSHGRQFTADLSTEGKGFFVGVYDDLVNLRIVVTTCFGDRACNIERSSTTRALIDVSPLEDVVTSIPSMKVDEAGVHLLIRRDDRVVGTDSQRIITLNPDGSKLVGVPTTFDGDFRTDKSLVISDDIGTRSVNSRWIDAAAILGRQRLVAIGSNLRDSAPNFLLVSDSGTEPREVPLSLPLGVRAYASNTHQTALLDDSSMVVTANVFSDAGRERRLYKVNIENGSVDVTFGTDGWVSIPTSHADGDGCESGERLVSGPGVVAGLVIDHDVVSIDGFDDCGAAPATVSWSTFTPAGVTLGEQLPSANVGSVGFTRVTGYLVDARGNLFVVGYRDVYEENRYVTSNATIAKFTATGGADVTFGVDGVVSLDGATNTLFSAANELIAAVDDADRVYVAAPTRGPKLDLAVLVLRLTPIGLIDGMTIEELPGSTKSNDKEATPRETLAAKELVWQSRVAVAIAELVETNRVARLPADNGLTVTSTRPVLTRAAALEDRALTVFWSESAAKRSWVTATALPSGRTCTSNEGSCVVRGLDPSVFYAVAVAPRGEPQPDTPMTNTVTVKPIVLMRQGRVASPTTFVRPASRGKASWRVRGGCALNEFNTRITMPKESAICQLSVTTAKFEQTPKTTKLVTIVVTK